MGSRSRPRRRTVKVARKATGAAPATRRRAVRGKPVRRATPIKAPGTLVSTEWLAAQLSRPQSNRPSQRLRILDGTWHMPQLQRDPRREFEEAHIPGAVFFDIDAIADRTTSLPHMLSGAAHFSRQVGELGISNSDLVVVYDVRGVVSAARVWWTFRAMGHDRVAVLDGGLRKWRAEDRPVDATPIHTDQLPPTPVRDRTIPAWAWVEAPATLQTLGDDLPNQPIGTYKRRLSSTSSPQPGGNHGDLAGAQQ